MKASSFLISQNGEGFELHAGSWQRRLQLTPFGVRTEAINFDGRTLRLSTSSEPTVECVYDGLSHLALRSGSAAWVALSLKCVDQKNDQTLRIIWQDERQKMQISREWQLLPGVEAWITQASIRSESAPSVEFGRSDYFNVVDFLPLDLTNWHVKVVRFYGQTDFHNEPTLEEQFKVGEESTLRGVRGNLLFLRSPEKSTGIFILHESPPEKEKRPECDSDFIIGPDGVRILGWGVAPHEVAPEYPLQSYRVAIGSYDGTETGGLEGLRHYLKNQYPLQPAERALVANPWGDRQCYENLSEDFVLEELDACVEIGVTHYQIDDGWQAGGVLSDLCIHNWARDKSFWDIHPKKFPNGFSKIAKHANKLGIELTLWFAPDCNRHYRNWREDRDIMLHFHRRYGINLFKIDAAWVRTKEAEENFKRLLQDVGRESDNKIRFNLDVTASQRLGYFSNLEYGSLFVENRYVNVSYDPEIVYAPHRTLRNLWKLSRYVPPEKMQFEVPNIAKQLPVLRNVSDATNAMHYEWEYIAAITLFCSPLVWCEPSRLSQKARAAWKHIFSLHREIRDELFSGYTFPIGQEPNGTTWTGFQSYRKEQPSRGLLLIFREWTEQNSHSFALHHVLPNARVLLECISHREEKKYVTAKSDGLIKLHITSPRDFRLYRYSIEEATPA